MRGEPRVSSGFVFFPRETRNGSYYSRFVCVLSQTLASAWRLRRTRLRVRGGGTALADLPPRGGAWMVPSGARGGGSGGGGGGCCQSWRAAGAGAAMEGQRWLPLEANPEVSAARGRSRGPSESGGRRRFARARL